MCSPRNSMLSPSTPGSRTRKRKRLRDTVSQLAQGESPNLLTVPGTSSTLGRTCVRILTRKWNFIRGKYLFSDIHRRRSSISEAAFLSLSGSFLDIPSPEKTTGDGLVVSPVPQDLKLMSPRQQVFMELLHTEMNYVEILETIVEVISLNASHDQFNSIDFRIRCSKNRWKTPIKWEDLC